MLKIFSIAAFLFMGSIVSIYNYEIPSVDNGTISLNNYQNKQIFIVNTASGSSHVGQLSALQQLYVQHMDSMVVIAFPSNSFGNEPKSNAEIKEFMQQNYGVSFPIAAKSSVNGNDANGIYKWFRDKLMNGAVNGNITSDFKKFLINRHGRIVGQFDSSVSPLSTVVQNAIRDNH